MVETRSVAEQIRSGFKIAGKLFLSALSLLMLVVITSTVVFSKRNCDVLRMKEQVLKQDLFTLNALIGDYRVDKQKAPQSLDDLVQAGYLKKLPVDPMTGNSDWATEQCDSILSLDQQDSGGIVGVHSASDQISSVGTAYSSWK
jgi:general secretion pathway protein G